jgi:hypothetical protein
VCPPGYSPPLVWNDQCCPTDSPYNPVENACVTSATCSLGGGTYRCGGGPLWPSCCYNDLQCETSGRYAGCYARWGFQAQLGRWIVVSKASAAAVDVSGNCKADSCEHRGVCTPVYGGVTCSCDAEPAASGAACTFRCPGGQDCVSLPAVNSTDYSWSDCAAGWHCSGGVLPAFPRRCPAGTYCPSKSAQPTPCPAGSVCPTDGLAAPKRCGAGTLCNAPGGTVQPLSCAAGQWCAAGAAAAVACPEGFACVTATTEPELCNATGTYCPNGSATALPCPAGFSCAQSMRLSSANAEVGTSASVATACPYGESSEEGGGRCMPVPLGECPTLQRRSSFDTPCRLTAGGIALVVCMALFGCALIAAAVVAVKRAQRIAKGVKPLAPVAASTPRPAVSVAALPSAAVSPPGGAAVHLVSPVPFAAVAVCAPPSAPPAVAAPQYASSAAVASQHMCSACCALMQPIDRFCAACGLPRGSGAVYAVPTYAAAANAPSLLPYAADVYQPGAPQFGVPSAPAPEWHAEGVDSGTASAHYAYIAPQQPMEGAAWSAPGGHS